MVHLTRTLRAPGPKKIAITGALSYTGRYITRLYLDQFASKSGINTNGDTNPLTIVNLSNRSTPIAGNLEADFDPNQFKIVTNPLKFACDQDKGWKNDKWRNGKGQSETFGKQYPEHLPEFLQKYIPTEDTPQMQHPDFLQLKESLSGCSVLYCTYFTRFIGPGVHDHTVRQLGELFFAAKLAGVERIIFSSHLHCDGAIAHLRSDGGQEHSDKITRGRDFDYIRGKALACEILRTIGIPSYGIVRPCGIFGDTPNEAILMNNSAWVIRRSPLPIMLPGDAKSVFQPIHVRDMSTMMVELGESETSSSDFKAKEGSGTVGTVSKLKGEKYYGPNNTTICVGEKDACGSDAPTAGQLFSKIRDVVRKNSALGRVPVLGNTLFRKFPPVLPGGKMLSTSLVTCLTAPINWLTGDILLDKDDLDLLNCGLTHAENPEDTDIAKRRSLFEWLDEVGPELGVAYVSSVKRYYGAKK